jgi:hypothetical protein
MKKYTLVDFHQLTFRNIPGSIETDEFDDLTNDPAARAYAHRATEIKDDLYDYVINYVFSRSFISRFSDGSFPAWYGAKDLKTTFYETIPHWKKTYIDAPQFSHPATKGIRSIFTVQCDAALIDLRDHQFINDKNAQQMAARFQQEGHPGLFAQSVRISTGENIIVFQKKILSNPAHHSNYIYEYDQKAQTVTVKHADSEKKLLVLDKDAIKL